MNKKNNLEQTELWTEAWKNSLYSIEELADEDKWIKIWKLDAKEGINIYQASYKEEYWAESFAKYLESESTRKNLTSGVRKYFDDLFEAK